MFALRKPDTGHVKYKDGPHLCSRFTLVTFARVMHVHVFITSLGQLYYALAGISMSMKMFFFSKNQGNGITNCSNTNTNINRDLTATHLHTIGKAMLIRLCPR